MANDPYRYFRVEARELLDGLVKGALDIEKGAPGPEAIGELLRLAHTLKGAARVVKQREIADHAHAVEGVLEPWRELSEPVPRSQLEPLWGLLDRIGERVAVLDSPEAQGPPPAGHVSPPSPGRWVRADVAEMDALLEGIGEAHTQLGTLRSGIAQVRQARGLADLIVQQLASPRGRHSDRDDGGSGGRARSMAEELGSVVATIDRTLGQAVEQSDRELRQVRDAAERLRLVPAGTLFTALERAARDVASEQGKSAVFEGQGGELRVDADVITATQSALQQIVRNAVAHGIEPEAERRAAGKPPAGRVSLEVTRRGRHAVFTCRDDGRGIDLEAVRSAAAHKRLLPTTTGNLRAEDLVRLLLLGGLSTSGTVTEVSGRGIGLDVVRASAELLGGDVTVTTEAGIGTTVRFEVPLSLTSLDALEVESEGETTMIPLDAVRRTLRVTSGEISASPEGDSLLYDDGVVPFMPLSTALWGAAIPARSQRAWSVVIVEGAGGLAAVGVQRLQGTANIVLRLFPELVPAAPVVAGASIDAEGTPRLVLDPDGLVAEARRSVRRVQQDSGDTWSSEPGDVTEDAAPRPHVLVVDDSLTTRMLERSILESAGYRVDLATSGEEALMKAEETRYSLFLVDVEMPGMDGFTFIERTRADASLRDIPCILVTSRGSAPDRARGLEVGALAYISKNDFDQRTFLDVVQDLVAGVT